MISAYITLTTKSVKFISILLCVKLFCTLFAIFVFSKFTPLTDAGMYLSGSYNVFHTAQRTLIIQTVAIELAKIGGLVFAHYIFGVFSLIGLSYYFLTGGKRWQFALFLIFPSALIWTSVIGKEAVFYGAFTLLLVIWSRFVSSQNGVTDIFLFILALVVCAIFRPHYGVVILWLFISTFLVNMYGMKAWPYLCLLALLALGFYFAFAWEKILHHGLGGIDQGGRSSRFVALNIIRETTAGFEKYKSLLLLGAIFGIIGPMPEELITRPEFIPFFLEGIFIIIFPAAVYIYASKKTFYGKKRFMELFWLCLIPAILALMLFHAPFGILNPGSATRWRVNFESIFLIAPILLMDCFFCSKSYANSTFSS